MARIYRDRGESLEARLRELQEQTLELEGQLDAQRRRLRKRRWVPRSTFRRWMLFCGVLPAVVLASLMALYMLHVTPRNQRLQGRLLKVRAHTADLSARRDVLDDRLTPLRYHLGLLEDFKRTSRRPKKTRLGPVFLTLDYRKPAEASALVGGWACHRSRPAVVKKVRATLTAALLPRLDVLCRGTTQQGAP